MIIKIKINIFIYNSINVQNAITFHFITLKLHIQLLFAGFSCRFLLFALLLLRGCCCLLVLGFNATRAVAKDPTAVFFLRFCFVLFGCLVFCSRNHWRWFEATTRKTDTKSRGKKNTLWIYESAFNYLLFSFI